jgi:hypothetical protein
MLIRNDSVEPRTDTNNTNGKPLRKYFVVTSLKGARPGGAGFSAFPLMIGLSALNSGLSTESFLLMNRSALRARRDSTISVSSADLFHSDVIPFKPLSNVRKNDAVILRLS